MIANRRLYQSYLLRIWRESTDGEWRASLQNVVTGECHNFPNLQAMFDYLEQQPTPPLIEKTEIDRFTEAKLDNDL